MLTTRRVPTVLLALAAFAAGCGGGSSGGDGGGAGEQRQGGSTQEGSAGRSSSGAGERCGDIPVPGHEATNVLVQGATCARADELVAAAVGKGRQAYEAAGFACEPSDAGGGDTNYRCSRGDSRVTFQYGAA